MSLSDAEFTHRDRMAMMADADREETRRRNDELADDPHVDGSFADDDAAWLEAERRINERDEMREFYRQP